MEDDLNFKGKRKTTFIFWQNGRPPSFLGNMEYDLNFWEKWKTTSILGSMEDDLNFLENVRGPQFLWANGI
jgi:hypothetical protein